MLILTVNRNSKLTIGSATLHNFSGRNIKVGIDAPEEVQVRRVKDGKQDAQQDAGHGSPQGGEE